MTDQQVEFDPAANGGVVAQGDDEIIAAIQAKSAAARARAQELRAELELITPELRRYDKAIAALRGAPVGHPQKSKRGPARAAAPVKIGSENLDITWAAIQRLTEQSDEFTQADVRAATGITSGVSSMAFEALRQDGRIRFARQQGNHKYFRLTHAQIEAEAAES